jgi:hypothetical protein
MLNRHRGLCAGAAAAASALLASCASGPAAPDVPATGRMGFFVTSANPGKGGDLGGLAGADAHCQRLAAAAGAGSRTWRAYLSVPGVFPSANAPGVASTHARDRIGKGPWYNAKGVLVARDLAHLHNGNAINKTTALTEKGDVISGRGDSVNNHDILTGSRADGTAFAPQTDTTCGNWTKSGDGSAIVGHHDRIGPLPEAWATSWNFAHQSAGCSLDALRRTGGAGLYYCFAAD